MPPVSDQTLALLNASRVYTDGVGRRSRSVQVRRVEAAQSARGGVVEQPADRGGERAAGQEAYEQARERAQARRERARGPWRQRGSRLVRAAVSDEEWARLAGQAAQRGLPASVYLGQLIRAQLTDGS